MAEQTTSAETHATVLDIGAEQLATVYAKSLLGATEKGGVTEAVVAELDAMISEVLDPNPRFQEVLFASGIGGADKEGVLDRVLGGRCSQLLLNFLKVLARRGRLDTLRQIQKQVHVQLDALRKRVRVQLKTAAPIDDRLAAELVQSLRPLVNGEPILETSVDPELIGGMVLRVGDTVLDGSVRRQLRQVHDQMIHRSVHEIQSRRDRFRHPDGN